MPTIKWLLKDSGLSNLRLLTSFNHINSPIRSVNVLDNPDVSKWFKKDELILTTGFVLLNNPELQRSIVRDLKEFGCAALAIKIRRFFHSIPEEILDEAAKLDFPIIELPFFYSFSTISKIIFNQLNIEANAQTISRQRFIQHFMDSVLNHSSWDNLLQQLADFLGMPVSLINEQKLSLCNVAPSKMVLSDNSVQSLLESSYRQGISAIEKKLSQDTTFRMQCMNLPSQKGKLLIFYQKEQHLPADDFLQRILRLLALAFEQQKLSLQNYEHNSSFFLHAIMQKQSLSEQEIKNLCSFYGFDFHKSWICLTTSLADFGGLPEDVVSKMKQDVMQLMEEDATLFICTNHNIFCCFYLFSINCHPLKTLHAVRQYARILIQKWKSYTVSSVPIGLSSCHSGVTSIRQSLYESLTALNTTASGMDEIHSYLHLLPSLILEGSPKNQSILIHHFLEPVIQYDHEHHTNLIGTLRAYLKANYNASLAAKSMYLHRNTTINHIEKIKELLDIKFDNAEENYLIYLALLAFDIQQ